eukprot:jgi/Ulvmu1/1425/UM011_0154.1
MSKEPERLIKFYGAVKHQERRRRAFVANSKRLREEALDRARKFVYEEAFDEIALEEHSSAGQATSGTKPRQNKRGYTKEYYANLLMMYEWMIGLPQDLGPGWRVLARPEGKRCLLIASRGRTVTRTNNGQVLHIFPSALPNGSANSRKQNRAAFSIFDAVFHEPDSTYYVVDVLAWNGVHLCASDVDCRMPWARSHFDSMEAASEPFPGHRFRIRMCDMHVCNESGLAAVYHDVTPYTKDGLIFSHSMSPYIVGGAASSPFALRWKDACCSRWPIDTDPAGSVLTEQHAVLAYRANGELVTGDAVDPVVLGKLPTAVLQQCQHNLKDGMLLRLKIGPGGFFLDGNGNIYGADLHLVGVANRIRKADLYSRIVFQWLLRTEQIRFQGLVDRVQQVSSGMY